MNYGKSGAPKTGKNAPRHTEHNAKGTRENPFGNRGITKAELVARMKALATERKSD